MLLWLYENIGTIIVLLVLSAIVALIVRRRIKDRKEGASSCGCGCENCALHGKCGGKQ